MNEHLSAWMDGELESAQARQLLSRLKHDFVMRQDWDSYHLIRDTMRGVEGPDLRAQIYARLAAEPTVLAPKFHVRVEKPDWFTSVAKAKVAAVALIAFVSGMALQSLQQNALQIAAAPETEVNQAGVLTEERARNYLIAHLRYSNSKALQGMPVYASADSQ